MVSLFAEFFDDYQVFGGVGEPTVEEIPYEVIVALVVVGDYFLDEEIGLLFRTHFQVLELLLVRLAVFAGHVELPEGELVFRAQLVCRIRLGRQFALLEFLYLSVV